MTCNTRSIANHLRHWAVLCCCLIPVSVHAQSEGMLWPIDAVKSISASFGEPRPGRFHMGVDFRSNGTTGRTVYAIGDGTVIRVKTTPFGEGKALYIRLDSGEIVVYMHLSRYTDAIEEELFSQRIARGSYDVDWYPAAGEYRFSKGDVVGWSGDSGSWGSPHLHLELRNANNIPINPLDHGLNFLDNMPPVMDTAVLIPLDKSSSIDGHPLPVWIDLKNPPTEPLALSGNIGVAVSVWDPVNNTSNRMGIYRASLLVDSTAVFTKTYDHISYDINGSGGLDYLAATQYGGKNTLSALFRRPGNISDFYSGADCLSCSMFPTGKPSILTVLTEDHPGNITTGSIPVIFGTRPWFSYCGFTAPDTIRVVGMHRSAAIERVVVSRRVKDGWIEVADVAVGAFNCDVRCPVASTGTTEYRVIIAGADGLLSLPSYITSGEEIIAGAVQPELSIKTELVHDRVIISIASNVLLASIPTVEITCNGSPQTGIHTPAPDGESGWIMAAAFPAKGPVSLDITVNAETPSLEQVTASATLSFTGVALGSTVTAQSPDGLLVMNFPADALYRSAPVTIEPVQVKTTNGMKPMSGGYSVRLADDPPHKAADLRITLDTEPPEHAAMYYVRPGGAWTFLSKARQGKTMTGSYNGTGRIAVFVDNTPPYVAVALPKPGGTTTDRTPTLQIRLEDRGSGIEGSDSIRMAIDGISVYGEYNTGAKTVTYRIRNPLNPGAHIATATVTDRAGNSTSREWKFTVQ